VIVTALLVFLGSQPVLFFFAHGFMDQLDFWAGSFGLLLFGFLEIVIFTRLFGMARGWAEINHGARRPVPRIFHFVIAWVMPMGMGAILLAWSATNLLPELDLSKFEAGDRPYVLGARFWLLGLLVAYWLAVGFGSRQRRARGES
jgi:hypothetical protein